MTEMTLRFPVVGIGSSAGGLHALEGFFAAMPANPGMAFVVITHLAPDHKSLLVEILARHAVLPVEVAVDGQMVELDKIYVMPPNATLTIADGRLRLAEIAHGRHERAPIDIFFSSLAQSCGEYAVGVILSGSGADGVLGVKAIKENGGLTIAQTADASGPGFASMPDSAIATGLIDCATPVELMAARLIENAKALEGAEAFVEEQGHSAIESPQDHSEGASGLGEQSLDEVQKTICSILRARTGHDFSGYKKPTFLRRMYRRMRLRQSGSAAAYVELLDKDPGEATLLFRDLLIKVTAFFRDPEAFEALRTLVVPRLFEGRDASDMVRVWVPGCATGEEVYSIAILLREYMDTLRAPPRVTIFATDIDEPTLAVARAGRYPEALLAGVSPERRRRFFTSDGQVDQFFVIAKETRDLCVFSAHSLLRDPPFSRMDLVSCRNLLIYFGADAQRQVLPILHYALQPKGYLFLGLSETIGRFSDRFLPVDKKHCVFLARDTGVRVRMPLFVGGAPSAGFSIPGSDRRGPSGPAYIRQSVETRIVEKFSPPHVIVNEDGDVVYFSARTGKYIEIPPGAPTQALLTTARKDLRLDLRRMLREAIKTRQSVTSEDLVIQGDDGDAERIDLTVEPLDHAGQQPLYLVVFNARGTTAPRVAVSSDDNALLESELRSVQDRLQGTIEEYETALEQLKSANEELVSLNEEMQSSNEELESSKEELQSLNEEMQTVNHELYAKIEDLDRANADLSNLFESSRIATVFLDRNLVIRSFTPEVARLFNIIATDKGRPLTDLAMKLAYPDLQADIRQVLETGESFERRVRGDEIDAPYYLARFTPYRSAAQSVDGVVATFIDVTSVAQSEERQRTLVAELNHRVKNVLAVILAIARQTLSRSASLDAFAPAFFARLQALARAHDLLSRKNWGDVPIEDLVEQALAPYQAAGQERIAPSGPSLSLPAKLAIGLGLALDELATNAVKYGALSNESGRIKLSWEVANENEGPKLDFTWRESGGPAVVAPEKGGFGLTLVKGEIEYNLGGEAAIDFAPDGLVARLQLPLNRLRGAET